jgi:hypothetical protein
MKNCHIDKSTLRCRACGATVSAPHVLRNCVTSSHPPGLGDLVAAGLASVGITKERVEALAGGPCGCDERAAALNAAGAKWLGLPPGSTAPPDVDPPT